MTPPASRRAVLKSTGLAAAGLGAAALTGCSKQEKISAGPAAVTVGEIPVGSGKILENTNYVVTQPTQGKFCAFVRVCPHAGCHVQQVQKAEIVCTCHNSRFSIEDGSCTAGPARAPLGKATATVQGETIKVSA